MSSPDFDFTQTNEWERRVKALAGEAHDLMEVNPAKASLRLTSIVGILNDWFELCEKLSAEERHPRQDVPPADMTWVR